MPASTADFEFMNAALSLAARNLGDTWPNPSVGCVIVNDGVIVGRGWTGSGGRPHAETEALARAGSNAKGATAYVTLEPCSHHGKTPPCAEALIAADVTRVVSATTDPDPRVSGQGHAKLRAAGITVEEGVLKAQADWLNAGFFLKVGQKRPLFCLKTATTLDGRIALGSGQSQWITGDTARRAAHALRARYDAILVGSGTALADDPMLTCRLEGYAGRPKVRVVLDRRARLPKTSKLLTTAAEIPTWVTTSANVEAVAAELAERGLTRVLIEGGGSVAAAFLKAGLIDELAWFRSGTLIGDDGKGALGALGLGDLKSQPAFTRYQTLVFGPDTLDILRKN
jgi:diaminohydroxyphosphoribosylaminopyrimidine deaminase/5-amino-6-(5-phosphoribosylamino)uracil reductase